MLGHISEITEGGSTVTKQVTVKAVKEYFRKALINKEKWSSGVLVQRLLLALIRYDGLTCPTNMLLQKKRKEKRHNAERQR